MAARAIQASRRQREAARAAITRICGKADNDALFNEMSVQDLGIDEDYIRAQWKRLDEQHRELIGKLDNEQLLIEEEQYYMGIENSYLACLRKIGNRLAHLAAEREVAQRAAMPAAEAARAPIIVRQVREPNVGTFDGKHEHWATFAESFRVQVHEREEIDRLDKLIYLKAACIGLAQKALGNWQTTAENYEPAWNSLQQKFTDQYATKSRLIGEIFRMPRMQEETYDGLRTLVDTPQVALQQLQAMGEHTEHWDVIIINAIIHRAPRTLTEAWERDRNHEDEPTLQRMYDWLDKRARGRMAIEAANNNSLARKQKPMMMKGQHENNGQPNAGTAPVYGQKDQSSRQNNGQPNAGTAPAFGQKDQGYRQNNGQPGAPREGPSTGARSRIGRKFTCWICGDEHTMFDCPVLQPMNMDERKRKLKEKGVCEQCARKHGEGECWKPVSCQLCNGDKHHDIICPKKERGEKRVNTNNARKRRFEGTYGA